MRVAVFSDVHGNLSALEAVLADMAERAVDQIVFAGDLCVIGPRPAQCLDRVRMLGCTAVFGNTDEWLLGRQQPPAHLVDLAAWTHDQLDGGQRSWLESLPFAHTVSAAGDDRSALLIVHANPRDVNQIIFPPEEEQVVRYGHIRQADGELEHLLSGIQTTSVVFGHLHIPFIRTWKDVSLVDISSVSMPGDGDPRAKYGIFTWDGEWSFERRFVSYDWTPETDAYRSNQPPGWQNFTEVIDAEGFISQKV